jgi:S-adenosylmethionine synthetase
MRPTGPAERRTPLDHSAFYTAESVTEGHPDKICDQISDAVLDAFLEQDKYARVACEALVTTGLVVVAGEITTKSYVDITGVVRKTLEEIGYTDPCLGFDSQSCAVVVMVEDQSSEIAIAVDRKGAGDQGIMVGLATDEGRSIGGGCNYMPVPIFYAHKLAEGIADARKSGKIPYLYPDGKSQITIRYRNGVPDAITDVVLSSHHKENVDLEAITDDLVKVVGRPLLEPTGLLIDETRFHVNPSGSFTKGGPMVDTGLTGRKIVVDCYGMAARHGGSAFSGKDYTKTDRSGAYAARYVAKNLVAAGAASKCEVQLGYIIGEADPVSMRVDTFGTSSIGEGDIENAVRDLFDLTPAGIIETLDLRRPIYRKTSCYGHFGREGNGFPWERTDMVEKVKAKLGC